MPTQKGEMMQTVRGVDAKWWKEGTLYQIYPQSFNDSTGDGFGDFQGILAKIDYIESLGVSSVWLNPFFESPLVDNGYDVADYKAIHPRYGTMQDFEELLAAFHARGINFVLDLVVNHSSDQHRWFKEACSSRENKYYDYYHWWPAEKGKPPYRHSFFDPEGGWDFVETNNSYYLHTFAKAQPDLKWENPNLRQEVYDIMKFWIAKGVKGFRLDAFQFASKDISYPAFPEGHEKEFFKWYAMRPGIHDFLREMYQEVLAPFDVFAVAEGAGNSLEDAHDLVDEDRKELQVAYHFDTVDMARTPAGFDLAEFKEIFTRWDKSFSAKGWQAIYLSNHDNARLVSRFGSTNPAFRTLSAQLLNTFLLSMRGTPYTHYGDELGMTNIDMPTIEEYIDIDAIGRYQRALRAKEDMVVFMENLNHNSRENARTPMQWDSSKNAGFSSGTPWMKVNPNHTEINVANQETDPNSVLNHFRKLTRLRASHAVLVYGQYEIYEPNHPQVYAYTRSLEETLLLVVLNFSENEASIHLDKANDLGRPLINNYDSLEVEENAVLLKPYQAVIVQLSSPLMRGNT